MAEAEFTGSTVIRHTVWEKVPGAALTTRLRVPGGWIYQVADAVVFVPYSAALDDTKCS